MSFRVPNDGGFRRIWAMAVATAVSVALAGCDSDVATSPFPAPTDYAIQGIDVSKYQGDVDWNAVSSSQPWPMPPATDLRMA